MELKRVRIEQIVPDENNPRKEFCGIKELARSLMANAADPGQPINAIVVVQDGDLYRIFDGERRYRAMLLNGTEEVNVIVFGDYDEAESAFGMLASDNKERLTDQERSQAVQHALQLGIKPATVDDIAGLKKGQASRIKKARKALGDAASQATIDQLLEASSLKDSGASDEDVESVLSAEPEDWKVYADAARKRIIKREFRDAAASLLSEHGHELVDEMPDGLSYEGMYTKLEKLEEYVGGDVPEGIVFRFCDSDTPSIDAYVPQTGAKLAKADSSAKQRDELEEALGRAKGSRFAWYMDALMPGEGSRQGRERLTPNVDGYICIRILNEYVVDQVLDYFGIEELPKGLPLSPTLPGIAAVAYYYEYEQEPPVSESRALLGQSLAGERIDPIRRDDDLGRYAEWAAAFLADGFEMDPAEREFYELVRANLEPATGADDGISRDGEDEPGDAGQDAPAETAGDELAEGPTDDKLALDELLDEAAAELRIADEAAPTEKSAASADSVELDFSSLSFDGKAVV